MAALVGVAPMNKESGAYQGRRKIRGGRYRIRTVLFMTMLSAIQSNATFKRIYTCLVDRKTKKSSLNCLYETVDDYLECHGKE